MLKMDIDLIEKQLCIIENETLPKMKDLLADIKLCTTDTSRNILLAAMKKYSVALSEFTL